MEAAYSQSSSSVDESLIYGMCEQTILGGLSVIFKVVLQLNLFIALYMEQVICVLQSYKFICSS